MNKDQQINRNTVQFNDLGTIKKKNHLEIKVCLPNLLKSILYFTTNRIEF